MRTRSLLSVVCLFTACQSTPSVGLAPLATNAPATGAFVDASYTRGPATAAPQVVAPDAAVAEVLRGALQCFETRRRVAVENLANVGTPAYKRNWVQISMQTVTAADEVALAVPVVVDVTRDFRQGPLQATGRPLDVAIDGEGLFAVIRHDGSTGYRRDGSFGLNADGKIVFANGSTAFSCGGNGEVLVPEITVPSDTLEISIDPDGRVSGRTAGSPDTSTVFGTITINRFVNPAGLRCLDGQYLPTERSGSPTRDRPGLSGLGCLRQGYRERSNVDGAQAMMELQELERQHEWLVRVLQQFGLVAP